MSNLSSDSFHCKRCDRDLSSADFYQYQSSSGNVYRRKICRLCTRAYNKTRYHKKPDYQKKYARARWGTHKDLLKSQYRSRYYQLRDRALEAYGGRCTCCGEHDIRFLTLDHVNGGGEAERRQHVTGYTLYRRIVLSGFPDGFTVLCYNCNCGRFRNGGLCPHVDKHGSQTIPSGSTSQANGGGSAPHSSHDE